MRNLDTTTSSFAVAAFVATAICLSVSSHPFTGLTRMSAEAADNSASANAPRAQWAASATGRVEPRDGIVMIGTQVGGRVLDVLVKTGDRVQAGDLMIKLDDEDLLVRVKAAAEEVSVRERERDEEIARGLQLERRQADDSVASAERALYKARLAFDDLVVKARSGGAGTTGDIDKARFAVNAAKEQLANSRSSLARVLARDGQPKTTRLESSLATARAELSVAETAVERTRIRAPQTGTVLNVHAKAGELVAPSPEAPLVAFGDLSQLRVKAEVEDRDAAKVRIGQRIIVKGDAFPNQQFEGIVTSIAQTLAAPRIATRGVRRPNDVEVLEVLATLDGKPPLLAGMRVDVFFKSDAPDTASAQGSKTN